MVDMQLNQINLKIIITYLKAYNYVQTSDYY